MKIHNIPKRFWKMFTHGGWLLFLMLSVFVMSQFFLSFLSVQRSKIMIYHIYIVNHLIYPGLLGGLIFCFYYFVMRTETRRTRCVLPNPTLIREIAAHKHFGKVLIEEWNPLDTLPDNLPTHLFPKNSANQSADPNFAQGPKDRNQWFLLTKAVLRKSQEKLMGITGKNHSGVRRTQRDEKLGQLAKAVETMQLGVTITDMDGKIIYTNPAEARMHGYEVDDLIGKDLGVLAPAELRKPMTAEQIKELRSLRESVNISKDGRIFPVRLMSDVVKDAAGQPTAVVTACENLTEHKRTEKVLKQRARELALLNRMSELLQACATEEDTYRVVGKVCKKLFLSDSGCLSILEPSQTKPKVVALWGNPSQHARAAEGNNGSGNLPFKPHLTEELETGSLCPLSNFHQDNDCLCVPIHTADELLGILSLCFRQGASGNADPQGDHHHLKARQILLTRVAEQYALSLVNLRLRDALRMECIRDSLTGLYNRRYMEESLKREALRAKRHHTPIGIIMLDIDHFKQFNDIYGHEAGDLVLKRLGTFLQRRTRGEDIACRYGGEEFLLILPETPIEVVVQRAKELHAGVKKLRIIYQGKRLHITISAGVAVLPEHSSTVKEVVKAADTAMYRAKEQGRDQVMVACA